MSKEKELIKNTLIITIGKISTQLISFLLLPLYTAILSTEEYGSVDLITTLVQLIAPMVTLMIDQGVFRYLLNCKDEKEQKNVFSSAFCLLTFCLAIFGVLYYLVLFNWNNVYRIWFILILVVTSYGEFFLQTSRGLKNTKDYTVASFIASTSIIVGNVIGLVLLKLGIIGMLAATFAGHLLCCVYLFVKLKIYSYIEINCVSKNIIKEELKYSFPLIPNQLSLWVMNSSDRLIVSYFLGVASNGILTITHKFPAIIMTFYSIFQLAWHETGILHYFDKDRDSFFSKTIKNVFLLFFTVATGMLIALPVVFNILINQNYFEAYYNIPIYVVAFLLNVFVGLLGVVYVATKKTKEIAKTTFFAAAINIVVHIVLIDKLGLYAASISTFVGYLLVLIYRVIDTKKYINIDYNKKEILIYCLIMIVVCVIYYYNNFIISIIGLLIYIPIALYLNRLNIKFILNEVKKKIGM